MSRAPSASSTRPRRRSSSVCLRSPLPSPLPSRRQSSALEEYPQTAVTRAIYHHAREFLAKAGGAAPQKRGYLAMAAVRRAARAVIIESTVVQVVIRCVERRKQLQAKEADEKWKMCDAKLLFGGQMGIESARRISQLLGDMLAGFEGSDDVRSRFLNVASTFDASETSLKQLEASFVENLDGLQAMRENFDRCTEEVIRLVSLLEGDCNNMRLQLHRTLRSPRARMNRNLFGLEQLGKSRILNREPSSEPDHISHLLSTLERDLCDMPLEAVVQVAQDVNDHIVKQLADSGKLEVSPRALPMDELAVGKAPSIVVEQMFETLKPFIFEERDNDQAGKGVRRPSREPMVDAPGQGSAPSKGKTVTGREARADPAIVMSPTSPIRPPVDISFACAQLAHNNALSREPLAPLDLGKKIDSSTTGASAAGTSSLPLASDSGAFSGLQRQRLKPVGEAASTRGASEARGSTGGIPELPGYVGEQGRAGNITHAGHGQAGQEHGGHASSPSRAVFGSPEHGDHVPLGKASHEAASLSPEHAGGDKVLHQSRSILGGVAESQSSQPNERRLNADVVLERQGEHHHTSGQSGEMHSAYNMPEHMPTQEPGSLPTAADPSELSTHFGSPSLGKGRSSAEKSSDKLPQLHPSRPGTADSHLSPTSNISHPSHASHASYGHGHVSHVSHLSHSHTSRETQAKQQSRGGSKEEPSSSRRRPARSPVPSEGEFSRFLAVDKGYEEQMSVGPFMGSPLLVRKSKIAERPRRQTLSGNASEPALLKQHAETLRRPRGLPAPTFGPASALPSAMGHSHSANLSMLRVRPASLDADHRFQHGKRDALPTLGDGIQASQAPMHRKASPARSLESASEAPEHELLR
ncbi:unnamed protein product [Effrenium voratum]|nr:unnamed protein product [Effrenium voratum]